MCNSLAQGGQRCSHHAKGVLERKATALRQAAERATNPGDVSAFHEAQAEWEQAAVDYASTPAGKIALTERMQAAAQADDPRTEALLGNIIQRGDQLREVNAQMKAVLTAAAATETGLPDERTPYEFAEDQNNNPLTEEERDRWVALMDSLEANHVSALSKPTNEKHTTYYVDQATDLIKRAKELDETVADAASTDDQIHNALYYFRGRISDVPSVAKMWHPAITGQARRAINHPNAGERTFGQASSVLPISDVLAHPRCPDQLVFERLNQDVALSEDQWKSIEGRAVNSALLTTSVARHHPNEGRQDEAVIRLMGTQWDTVDAKDMRTIHSQLSQLPMTDSQRELLELSLVQWVQQYGDEHHRSQMVWQAQESTSEAVRELVTPKTPAAPEPASSGRKSFWA
jgi:hypothetical protein